MPRLAIKILCFFNVHWSGRSGQSSMQNCIRCDHCSDGYVDGFLIHDRNRRK